MLVIGTPTTACGQADGPEQPNRPEQAYWQQEVHYTIEASLDEERGVLHGLGRVTYVNRSPDTLDRLFFHQHLNAFRPNSIWAGVERRRQLDFQGLDDPDHAFERLIVARPETPGPRMIIGVTIPP